MSWYRASTISLTNGSTAVTGAATDFIANCAVGEGLLAPDGKVYEIAAIVSATALTLGSVYLGSTASGQSYAIIPSQSYLRDLALQAATLVNDYQSVLDSAGAGKFGDGTLGSPGIQFSSDSNTGLRRTGTDAVALVTGAVDRITVDAAGAVAVVASLSVAGSAVPTIASTSTLTNKTLALGSNTISGTLAQFNTAVTDADLASLAGTETLTNKTLTSPAINGGVIDTTSTTATAAVGTSSTRLANTAFVQQEKEYLPALSQSLHIGAVVKAIVYDTSKDSDGGAWRKRCADKSWYTETLGGDRWISQHATIAAAWTAAGSTTGAVYQASATAGAQTSGLFYTPTSSTTVTQVYRGVTREFPAVAGIVAESARVVIYDLSNGAMWMVFADAATAGVIAWGGSGPKTQTCVAMRDSTLITGTSDIGGVIICFAKDDVRLYYGITAYKLTSSRFIADRNAVTSFASGGDGYAIVNSVVNDVAITVLDTAPTDPATGLPVPTIYAFTAGGVSRIADDGTVSSTACTGGLAAGFIVGAYVRGISGSIASAWPTNSALPTGGASWLDIYWTKSAYYATGVPATLWSVTSGEKGVLGSALGATLLKENPTTPTKGMVAYVTTAYNTGWLPGDIRGAYLADTTAETVTASGELVTNGTFTTDTTGWGTAAGNTTLSVASAALRVALVANGYARATQSITTVAGRTYTLVVTGVGKTVTDFVIAVGTVSGGLSGDLAIFSSSAASGTFVLTFTATTTTTYLAFGSGSGQLAGQYADFDNISVKLAEPDRSVKNKGLVINGTLTKTAVASGAGLVAYSGFSGSNYLEQPYNSDLDFGTGDFCVMGWVQTGASVSGTYLLVDRSDGDGTPRFYLNVNGAALNLVTYADGAGYSELDSSASAIAASTLYHICAGRNSAGMFLYVNGVSNVGASVTPTTARNLTSVSLAAPITLGASYTHATPFNGSMALWRISATAPSADQIAHIYRTELPLFQASAQCTLAGSSTAVTALAYDDTTELLHVGTSWGRTGFKDLLRVDSEATTTGALTSLSASQGVIITGGTSGKVYVPAMLLRDELRRKDEARKALGRVPVFFDYTATASQTAFVAPKGYTIKAVYHNGTLKRETTTGVYWTRSSDGFAETCTLSAGATVSDWISLMCVRT